MLFLHRLNRCNLLGTKPLEYDEHTKKAWMTRFMANLGCPKSSEVVSPTVRVHQTTYPDSRCGLKHSWCQLPINSVWPYIYIYMPLQYVYLYTHINSTSMYIQYSTYISNISIQNLARNLKNWFRKMSHTESCWIWPTPRLGHPAE